MPDTSAYVAGELGRPIPSMKAMASSLREAGLHVTVGRYSIRINDCSNFAFQEYGGDLGDPVIEADADTVEDMTRDAKLVSDALSHVGIKHRFEIYRRGSNDMATYMHFHWPSGDVRF